MKNKRSITPASFINSKITATISISLVLFLLGLIILLSLSANNLSTYVKETLSFDIVLHDEASDAQIQQLQKKLENSPFAKSVSFRSKADAAKQLEADLGQNPEEFLGYNPLPAMLIVNLNAPYANIDSLAVVERSIKGYSNNIQEVEYRKDLMQVVNENMRKVGVLILGLAVLLLFISFALINNTIRLTVYSKRFLIHTMRLVGATGRFIKKPFIRTNIAQGIIAAFIAMAGIYGLLMYLMSDIRELEGLIDLKGMAIIFICVLVLGIAISYIATHMAVNKYIRMKGDDMYYI